MMPYNCLQGVVMEQTQLVRFVLNGTKRELTVVRSWTLLHVLREVYHLTGTKYGCGTNDCGSCKVLIDGKATNSCSFPMHKLEGKHVLTIEGVRDNPKYRLVPEAFVRCHAVQCGFCTPGMVIAALGLLLENPHPTEHDVAEALSGNLCRCTGYVNILKAVLDAAGRMEEYTHGQ